ncbi:O-glucosyltransferase rumi-like protein [Cucumis melo var. makuwa]|uniref:O-glucosyltransferase rumi-like protein n=1 Tax=Cucumis melo var. makuwa TaxID=1194695 RepID=A0A5D3DGW6_CUCMM|nr:O-glucosyltransferase rumi-like protein [Cucumis melo var. makuwa]TYK22937.1 O-glucosyltransferase rumi-like protein [Cucumis melo var. makuwa]
MLSLLPKPIGARIEVELQNDPRKEVEFSPVNCTAYSRREKWHSRRGPTIEKEEEDAIGERQNENTCPEYFQWIHEDLKPWAGTGITREMVERGRGKATFRLVIVGGRVYVEKYSEVYQRRDIFTLWGILQLLRWYPDKIPDLDLMFSCEDQPNIFIGNYSGPGPNSMAPPPLFRYCGDDDTLDIVFPDWSFWGWPEINIKPWETLMKELKEGNGRKKWINRENYAYWKGNAFISMPRYKLLKCSRSTQHDWKARVYMQDWHKEVKQGFKNSNLADQCFSRYKIYIEGIGWSVSLKYILACDSMTLMVKPHFYDFFTRSLVPMHHYWPIKDDDDMCKSIKFAVEWGNAHKKEAQAIGKAASKYMEEQLNMEKVYDYMFHSLNEYSKLLTFKPTIPPNATEISWDDLACPNQGLAAKFMMDTLVKRPSFSSPCFLLPPFSPIVLDYIRTRKETPIEQIGTWEKNMPL